MAESSLSRRGFLAGAAALGGTVALGGCVSGGSNSSGSGSTGKLTLQATLSTPQPKKALQDIIADYKKQQVTLNFVALEQFRAQLPTYLNSSDPPDVLTWYAGSVAADYARKGFLLDVSDLWQGNGPCAHFSPALRKLSTDDKGRQIFVPTSYYWWGIFYRKSMFRKWGVEPVETWSDFLKMCRTLKGKGVMPLSMGTGAGQPWVASGWFDYLDLRINGAKFHRELLVGKHRFDSPEVKNVMKYYAQLVPYIDPKGRSLDVTQAVTPLVQGKDAMYLTGAFMTAAVPKDAADDIDFFRVPIIDKSVPVAEEAPTDGYFASAKTKHAKQTKQLLSYLASPGAEQKYIQESASSNLPTSPKVDTSKFPALVQKGIKFLNESKDLTQFFNRDSSDELQTTADTALTKFLDHPDQVDKILKAWQADAERVWNK